MPWRTTKGPSLFQIDIYSDASHGTPNFRGTFFIADALAGLSVTDLSGERA